MIGPGGFSAGPRSRRRPTILLSPASPLRDLAAHLSLTEREMAAARGVAQQTYHRSAAAGDGVSLRVLRETVEAAGYELRIEAVPRGGAEE